jgi:hypothetical protein
MEEILPLFGTAVLFEQLLGSDKKISPSSREGDVAEGTRQALGAWLRSGACDLRTTSSRAKPVRERTSVLGNAAGLCIGGSARSALIGMPMGPTP